MPGRLLIIDDDDALRQMLCLHFQDRGYHTESAGSCREALNLLRQHRPALVLLDQQLPDGMGIELLPPMLDIHPGLAVIMMTGKHDLELAIAAIKKGAADFLHKPLNTEILQAMVEQHLQRKEPHRHPAEAATAGTSGSGLIGRSDAMLKVSKDIALSAGNAATVLISGESGTGKELVAKLIHRFSGRKGQLITVNCAALVDSLLESELFGHEKGAFTGALARKPGRFELATDGTLFLDEIAELAPRLQAKLLRVLQERRFERVGGTETLHTNARIIAASHEDIFQLARNGAFREDLAYRLAVISIHLPPLRERREDIPLLITALLTRAAGNIGSPIPGISQSAVDLLMDHHWPGNVRELENVLTQAAVQARGTEIRAEHIRFRSTALAPDPKAAGVLLSLDELQAAHIQKVLNHTGGHKGRSCHILGISRPALDRKISKYRLRVPEKQRPGGNEDPL